MTLSLLALTLCAPAVEIIAHRGASHDAPENTLASFHLAWRQRADVVELDVFLSKDGRIVVLHDATLKRTAGVDRRVADLTAAELTQLDVGRWRGAAFAGERLPLLDDVLKTVPDGRRLFIEVKCGPEIVPELDRVLRASGLKPEQTAIISFSAEVVAAVKQARPDLQVYWIVSLAPRSGKKPPAIAELVEQARSIRADGLDLSANPEVLTPDAGRSIREAGLRFYVWTVNDVELARAMIAAGAEGITTDRPGWLREQLADGSSRLRVLCYNIRHGRGTDDRIDLERIAAVIRSARPDLVALQEVDHKTRRSGGVDQTAELARLTALHGRFAKAIDFEGGEYGQAILSRMPPGEMTVHPLPGEPEREQRIAGEIRVTFAGRELTFVTTHLHHRNGEFRQRQAARLNALFGASPRPTILAGDLNALPDSPPLHEFKAWGRTTAEMPPTYPADRPTKAIDYILYRPTDGFRVVEFAVIDEPLASDHRPILAVVDLLKNE